MTEFEGTPNAPLGPDPVSIEQDERRRLLEEVMSDEALPLAEKQARLDALAREWNIPSDSAEEGVASDPVRVQIANALALLAQGGHQNTP